MHDLNETNLGLTLFSAELPWCCFCVEIKVLGMERKFARNFYTIKENFWSQDLPERGTWVGTAHQGTPPLLARPGGLYPPGGPADHETDTINSYFSRKKSRRKNYHDPRDGAAATSCSSLGGQICSLFGAPERGIFVLCHHQPFSIANSMMLPTGSE